MIQVVTCTQVSQLDFPPLPPPPSLIPTFIMTMLTLSKNLRRGRPSSPHCAMAIPVTTANTTRPRMFVELGFRIRVS